MENTEQLENHEEDSEKKRKFAQEQLQFLKDNGIQDPNRLSNIFKAAGPGQIQEAYKLATSEEWDTEEGKIRLDVLNCLLQGSGGAQGFGKERMEKVLNNCNFYVPKAYNSYCFFRTLDGALEILIPNSYIFEEEEK